MVKRGGTRLARALGLDRNPLCRATDRAEAWIRIGLLAILLIAGPMAALGVGHWAYHGRIAAARAPAVPRHLGQAALRQAPLITDRTGGRQGSRPGSGTRWLGSGSDARLSAVLADAGADGRPPARSRLPDQAAPSRLGDGLVQSRTAVVQTQAVISRGERPRAD
jgi:hypothetical protein